MGCDLIASPHRLGARSGPRDDLCVEAVGLELHTALSSADTDDSLLFEPLLETNLGVRGYGHRHGVESSCRVGWVRWSVERAVFWLLRFKHLGLRYDRTPAHPCGRCSPSAATDQPASRRAERALRPDLDRAGRLDVTAWATTTSGGLQRRDEQVRSRSVVDPVEPWRRAAQPLVVARLPEQVREGAGQRLGH